MPLNVNWNKAPKNAPPKSTAESFIGNVIHVLFREEEEGTVCVRITAHMHASMRVGDDSRGMLIPYLSAETEYLVNESWAWRLTNLISDAF